MDGAQKKKKNREELKGEDWWLEDFIKKQKLKHDMPG